MDSAFDQYKSLVLVTGNVLDHEEQFKRAKTPSQEVNYCNTIVKLSTNQFSHQM